MNRTPTLILLTVAVACFTSVAWLTLRKQPPPKSQDEVFKRAFELETWGRYDKAVELFQSWLADKRRDVSHDDFLYQQIAMVYVVKAHKLPVNKDDSVQSADLNLQKALAVYEATPTRVLM